MKILIDIGHPAHVHYYRNLIKEMQGSGHEFLVVARDRSVVFDLLKRYRIPYFSRGKGSNGLIGKLIYLFYGIGFVFLKALRFKPDLFLSQGGVYTAPVAWMLRKPSIVTEDTENATFSHRIALKFKSSILSPSSFSLDFGKKHVKFNSFQELFYLHPDYFKPDDTVYDELGIDKDRNYVLLRFVDWNAHHDIGLNGLSVENKIRVVEEIAKNKAVFILADCELPEELDKLRIKVQPHHMHDVMNFADMLFGESSTMASESACMGTPAIFIDEHGRGYTDEQEKEYGLVFNFKESEEEQNKAINQAIALNNGTYDQELWAEKRAKLLQDKINPTRFLIWFIENYPESLTMVKNDPDYLDRFK